IRLRRWSCIRYRRSIPLFQRRVDVHDVEDHARHRRQDRDATGNDRKPPAPRLHLEQADSRDEQEDTRQQYETSVENRIVKHECGRKQLTPVQRKKAYAREDEANQGPATKQAHDAQATQDQVEDGTDENNGWTRTGHVRNPLLCRPDTFYPPTLVMCSLVGRSNSPTC